MAGRRKSLEWGGDGEGECGGRGGRREYGDGWMQTYSPNMSAVLACNLPGQLHAGLVAHPKKSKTISSKRHDALLARSRFWREVQREKKVEQ
eukprot:748931-Hanusia_phi.AAC.1